MLEILIDAAIRGSAIALLAVGLTMVQGTLNFANIAHMEFATLAGYGAVALTGAGLNLVSSTVLSVLGVGAIAVVFYRLLFRRLLRSGPLIAMIGSLALSIVLRALLQLIFGSRPQQLPMPLQRGIEFGGALVTPSQIKLIIITVALLAVTVIVLHSTTLGRAVRAVAANPDLAAVSGLNRARVIDSVWVISAVLAGTAGVLLSIESAVSTDIGFSLLLPVFAAAIVGGLGSVWGAILASYLLAIAEALALRIDFGSMIHGAGYLAVTYRPAVGFVLLIAMLVLRPQGLMGKAVRRG